MYPSWVAIVQANEHVKMSRDKLTEANVLTGESTHSLVDHLVVREQTQ